MPPISVTVLPILLLYLCNVLHAPFVNAEVFSDVLEVQFYVTCTERKLSTKCACIGFYSLEGNGQPGI